MAAYVALGVGASLWLAWLRAGNQRPAGWITPTAAAFRFGVGTLVVVLPCIAWLAWSAGTDAWQDLLVFPATTFSQVRNNDYPPLLPPLSPLIGWLHDLTNRRVTQSAGYAISDWILCNLPQYVFLGAGWVIAFRPRVLNATTAATAILWLSCMPLFWMAAHVQTNTPVFYAVTGRASCCHYSELHPGVADRPTRDHRGSGAPRRPGSQHLEIQLVRLGTG